MQFLLFGVALAAFYFYEQSKKKATFQRQNAPTGSASTPGQAVQQAANLTGQVSNLFPQARKVTRDFNAQDALALAGSSASVAKNVGVSLAGLFKDLGVDQSVSGTGGASPASGEVQTAMDFQALNANVWATAKAMEAAGITDNGMSTLGLDQSSAPQTAEDLGVEGPGWIDGFVQFNYPNTQQPGNVNPTVDTGTDQIEQAYEVPQPELPAYEPDLSYANPEPVTDGFVQTDSGAGIDMPQDEATFYDGGF